MSNKDIAKLFHELSLLMELHDENPFRIRSYENAYLIIRKLDIDLLQQSKAELMTIKGIGEAIAEKIIEIKNTSCFQMLNDFRAKTPTGVQEMIQIKGLGPKKVKIFWKEMEVESPGELLYACHENRLLDKKGYGVKIQNDIIQSIEFLSEQKDLFLWSTLELEVVEVLTLLRENNAGGRMELTGAFSRAEPVLSSIEIIADNFSENVPDGFHLVKVEEDITELIWKNRYPIIIYKVSLEEFETKQEEQIGGSSAYMNWIHTSENIVDVVGKATKNLFIPPECRDLEDYTNFSTDQLIEAQDIKGVIHNHSTYSDGIYSISDMANECIRLGYKYLVMSDHSKSAGYANGLKPDRVFEQWNEIEKLNTELSSFKIFKSIESDILADGSLDYDDDILKQFDLVIASIHSNLKMDMNKAMIRLIKAIENPYTRILGHPTGRLLLSRKGYPIDHKKIIDACAANDVSIELNSNPMRLDMDWKWIPYASSKGVLISINPDAHNLRGIQDIRYGVLMARKAGLQKNNCLNSKTLADFEQWIRSKNRIKQSLTLR
ncbi:MAG: PHP domain-containing protein [Bacteroidota bacterium]|nr:PHP domain-containing protein [Bacteroidota bacterium]